MCIIFGLQVGILEQSWRAKVSRRTCACRKRRKHPLPHARAPFLAELAAAVELAGGASFARFLSFFLCLFRSVFLSSMPFLSFFLSFFLFFLSNNMHYDYVVYV